jgi:hypothetical protein
MLFNGENISVIPIEKKLQIIVQMFKWSIR